MLNLAALLTFPLVMSGCLTEAPFGSADDFEATVLLERSDVDSIEDVQGLVLIVNLAHGSKAIPLAEEIRRDFVLTNASGAQRWLMSPIVPTAMAPPLDTSWAHVSNGRRLLRSTRMRTTSFGRPGPRSSATRRACRSTREATTGWPRVS